MTEEMLESSTVVDPTPAPAINPANQPIAGNQAPSNPTRAYVYGAIAAIFGIVAGLAFATIGVHQTPPPVAITAPAPNSNATSLATVVTPPMVALPAANIPAIEAPQAIAPADLHPKPAAHKKARKKALEATGSFAIEGDDELVGYDASRGIIQTSARKVFVVNSTSRTQNAATWQDSSANLHYKCDMNGSCTLSRKGAPVLFAQLKK